MSFPWCIYISVHHRVIESFSLIACLVAQQTWRTQYLVHVDCLPTAIAPVAPLRGFKDRVMLPSIRSWEALTSIHYTKDVEASIQSSHGTLEKWLRPILVRVVQNRVDVLQNRNRALTRVSETAQVFCMEAFFLIYKKNSQVFRLDAVFLIYNVNL